MRTPWRVRSRFLVGGFLAGAAYFGCPFRFGIVQGDSMQPALQPGTVYLLDRQTEAIRHLKRGDIIVFQHANEILTKRVFGAPGDVITLLCYGDGTYEVPYPGEATRLCRVRKTIPCFQPRIREVRVPNRCCFVLGDNARASYDSREFGYISLDAVLGRLMQRVGIINLAMFERRARRLTGPGASACRVAWSAS